MKKTPLLLFLLFAVLTVAAADAPKKDVTLFWTTAQDDATNRGICDGLVSKAGGKGMAPHPNTKIADKWIADDSGADIDVEAGQELRIFLRNATQNNSVSFWLDNGTNRIVEAEVPPVEFCGGAWQKVKYAEKGKMPRFDPDYRCDKDVAKEGEGWADHICVKVPADAGGTKWKISPFNALSNYSAPTVINIHPVP